jgi:hypothetical protein
VVKSVPWNIEDVEQGCSMKLGDQKTARGLRAQIMRKIVNRTTELYVAAKNRGLGQSYTEYVILLALIALVAYVAVQTIGTDVSTAMSSTSASV